MRIRKKRQDSRSFAPGAAALVVLAVAVCARRRVGDDDGAALGLVAELFARAKGELEVADLQPQVVQALGGVGACVSNHSIRICISSTLVTPVRFKHPIWTFDSSDDPHVSVSL